MWNLKRVINNNQNTVTLWAQEPITMDNLLTTTSMTLAKLMTRLVQQTIISNARYGVH